MPRMLFKLQYIRYLVALVLVTGILCIGQGLYAQYLFQHYPNSDLFTFTSVSLELRTQYPWVDLLFRTFPAMLFFILLPGTVRSLYRAYENGRDNELARRKQTESELQLLKAQLNPHFLFNVLNSIYALTLRKSDLAPDVVLKLSDILRYLLYDSNQKEMPLQKEIQVMNDYIDLERIRISPSHRITVQAEVDNGAYQLAPGVLLTIVENAVKHGLDSVAENGYIDIIIKARHGVLEFSCSNNYKTPKIKLTSGGIGLSNIRKRLELVYPGRHTLKITDENQLFGLFLSVNLSR